MTPALESLRLFALAGLAFVLVGSLVAAAIVRCFGPTIAALEPRARHRAVFLLAILPPLACVGLLLSASLPSLLALAAPGLDHCTGHDDGHAHLCFVHLPRVAGGGVSALLLTLVAGYGLLRIARCSVDLVRASAFVRTLARTGQRRSDLGVTVVETSRPICAAAGLLRPTILMSRCLLDLLSDDERAIVLAHEREHVRRRDALLASAARVCSMLHVPAAWDWLGRELELAAEQACDEQAATEVGDRIAVAAAILAVERAVLGCSTAELGATARAFGEGAIERRVASLLATREPAGSRWPFSGMVGVAVAALLAVAWPLHHATESLISLLAH